MSSVTSMFTSSIGKKLVMGLTGLFLVSFLIVHLSGNLLLFKADGGIAFNHYTQFMTTNPIIRIMEWVLFAGFLIHIIYAAILTRSNRKARPQAYAYKGNQGKSSSWFSRNMGLSGTVVLAFLIIHLTMFWGKYKFGDAIEQVSLEQAYEASWKLKAPVVQGGKEILAANAYLDFETYDKLQGMNMDLQAAAYPAISMTEVVKSSFSEWYIVLFYILAMVLLAFHLNHGFQSAFRTLGLVHKKYTPLIRKLGTAFAIAVPLVFAAMPAWYFIQSMLN